jgi:hypothetical protein
MTSTRTPSLFAFPLHREPTMPEPPEQDLAQFTAGVPVRLQTHVRRDTARALALAAPPPPSAPDARALVLGSLLTRIGPPEAESFDADTELERTLGLPAERRRALEHLDPDDIGLLIELSEMRLLSCHSLPELFEPLVIATHERWRSTAWQRNALTTLTPTLRDAGVQAVLIAAPASSMWRLEQCLPAGRLALLYPLSSDPAVARDAQSVLATRDDHAPPGPWDAAAHLDSQPVAWAPATRDALLLAPHPALGLDSVRAGAARALRDVLNAALPTLSGVHGNQTAIDRDWEMAIETAERLLATAEQLTSELREHEWQAREHLMAARAAASASDQADDWRRYMDATARLLALMLERRRLAHQRLAHAARAAALIATLPGVARAEDTSTDRYDDRSITIHTQANPDRPIRLPLDPLQAPVMVHPDGTRAPIELDAATIPYLEAIIARPRDAAQILLDLTSAPPRVVSQGRTRIATVDRSQSATTAACECLTLDSRHSRHPGRGSLASILLLSILVYWMALLVVVMSALMVFEWVIVGLVPWLLAVSVDAMFALLWRRPRRLHLSDPLRWLGSY